jgi:dTDP-4-amino-4,6-dideoxygalactose transaminase
LQLLPVDLFGQPADIDSITDIAHTEGIKVLLMGAKVLALCRKDDELDQWAMLQPQAFFPAKAVGLLW